MKKKYVLFFFLIFFINKSFSNEVVNIIFFEERGCPICYEIKTKLIPENTKKIGIKYNLIPLLTDKHLDKLKVLSEKYNFNIKAIPVVFISNIALAGKTEIEKKLLQTLKDFKEKKLKNINILDEVSELEIQKQREKIKQEVKKWSLTTIIGAGLIDGINPCAFATIIFLISYLAYAGRKRKEIAIIGSIYTFAVFLTYILVGILFYDIIDRLKNVYNIISNIIFYITLSLCIVFAIFTFFDFLKALKQKSDEMKLVLPKKFKQKIHKVIREKLKMKGLIISSIIIGFLVSIFELACTGQIYLPTILFILNQTSMKITGLSYLLIYNLAFILPLVIIFVLNLLGVSSKKLQGFLQKNIALMKFLLFILFIGLIAYLIIEKYFI